MGAVNFDALFQKFTQLKAGVIGDVMLDTYMWGHVDRISPEAPVPVVSLDKKEYRIGGAANVALNLASLGATVSMLSVIGADDDGKQLQQLLEQKDIRTDFLLASAKRITTSKTRIISRNQQMMRLDNEITNDLGYEDEQRMILAIQMFIAQEKPDVIIFEDYNKGVLTETVIQKAIDLCRHNGIITTVDPKRKNFFAYKAVDVFKPNLKEVKDGLNLLLENVNEESLRSIHTQLQEKLNHSISFITLSEKGVFYQKENEAAVIPSHLRYIADVSGAGDTVIAVASLVYAATNNVQLMAEMANIAGGLVCEEVGTAAIKKDRLLQECKHLLG
ncbi:rfaE bifunctional protein kinase chain/domain [Lacibacter cauensis]|uniref:RfaE bifunctional protein kinase chain/domain n=1 Tax=Lacibacter cauensis TaxID=510947 RepID=A0A562SCH9_9BACT|nr:PfkB family carbohydrate kinase [Lacibacter cauensis]TWI79065.1 rfaE bifunctional protein kinase chain/domain [Lacibacter cauensis]